VNYTTNCLEQRWCVCTVTSVLFDSYSESWFYTVSKKMECVGPLIYDKAWKMKLNTSCASVIDRDCIAQHFSMHLYQGQNHSCHHLCLNLGMFSWRSEMSVEFMYVDFHVISWCRAHHCNIIYVVLSFMSVCRSCDKSIAALEVGQESLSNNRVLVICWLTEHIKFYFLFY
jgi:hypothetical protein